MSKGSGTIRVCLKCEKSFDSKGFGNRLCRKCNKDNARKTLNRRIRMPDVRRRHGSCE